MMTKEEYLSIASQNWDNLHSLKSSSENLYEYEKTFDELWVEFGRISLEGSLGEISEDRRKKKSV